MCVPALANLHLYQPDRRGCCCLCLCFTQVLCVSAVEGSLCLGQPVWPILSAPCLSLCLCVTEICAQLCYQLNLQTEKWRQTHPEHDTCLSRDIRSPFTSPVAQQEQWWVRTTPEGSCTLCFFPHLIICRSSIK